MRAYDIFLRELNKAELLYAGSIHSYKQNRLRNSEKIDSGYINSDDLIVYDQGKDFKIVISNNKQEFDERMNTELPKYLRETIFIRIISIFEFFIIDLLKEIFARRKDLFHSDERLELSQRQLLSFESISNLHTYLINLECRKIQNQGFLKISDYFNKRLKINFHNCNINLKEIMEMHDRRNILVHRLGRADETYRRKYGIEDSVLTVGRKYIIKAFSDIKSLSKYLYDESMKLFEIKRNIYSKDPRFGVEIDFITLTSEYVNVLDKDFSFLCGEEILYFKDLIYRHHYNNETKIHSIKMSGSPYHINNAIRQFDKCAEEKLIEIYKCKTNEGIKRIKYNHYTFSKAMLRRIDELLPYGELPPDITSIISKKCGIREIQAKQAINKIIERRFKDEI